MPIVDLLSGGLSKKRIALGRGYLAALIITAAAALLQIASQPVLYPFPLLFYLPAVVLATLYGGAGPGALAAVVSAACVFHFAWPGPHLPGRHLLGSHFLGSCLGLFDARVALPFLSYAVVAAASVFAVQAARSERMRLRLQYAETIAQLSLEKERLASLQRRMTTNMQAVASLLTLQKIKLRSDPGSAARIIDDARQRVVELSQINRRLSEYALGGQGMAEYLRLLCADFQVGLAASHDIRCTTADDVDIKDPDKLLALSVLVGEAVGNALRHGFRENQAGTIAVNLRRTAAGRCQLTIADNGRGLPYPVDPAEAASSGFVIMRAMAVQLAGQLEASPSKQGTTLIVNFEA